MPHHTSHEKILVLGGTSVPRSRLQAALTELEASLGSRDAAKVYRVLMETTADSIGRTGS